MSSGEHEDYHHNWGTAGIGLAAAQAVARVGNRLILIGPCASAGECRHTVAALSFFHQNGTRDDVEDMLRARHERRLIG